MNCWVPMAIAGLAAASLGGAARAAPPAYRVVVLNVQPLAGDSNARATAVAVSTWHNAETTPWVAVQIETASNLSRAVLCNPQNICVDPFPTLKVGSYATAVGVNNDGRMIGTTKDEGSEPLGYYYLAHNRLVSIFRPPTNDCRHWEVTGFIPEAIASNGNIVGAKPKCGHPNASGLYRHTLRGHAIPEGAVSATFSAFHGEASTKVGTALLPDGSMVAFVHHGWRLTPPKLLGTLGGRNSKATSVNAAGRGDPDLVVGCSETAVAGELKPFSWDGAVMKALPTFGDGPACAMGINAKGTIVGNGQKSGQRFASTAFIYERSKMYDLNDVLQKPDRKYHILEVSGISNRGDISATAISDDSPYTVAVRLEVIK